MYFYFVLLRVLADLFDVVLFLIFSRFFCCYFSFLKKKTDIEGHLGLDDRYYLIDAARLFPPDVYRYVCACGVCVCVRASVVYLCVRVCWRGSGRQDWEEGGEQ